MKRDLDLQRKILLAIEARSSSEPAGSSDFLHLSQDEQQIEYEILLLDEAGLILTINVGTMGSPNARIVQRLTHDGHEYLDLIRDDDIWAKTKDGAQAVGGFSLTLLGDLAKGFVKQKIAKHTGIEI